MGKVLIENYSFRIEKLRKSLSTRQCREWAEIFNPRRLNLGEISIPFE